MVIAPETIAHIGQPESELLEYKAVLPPAATIAQLISAFSNTKGGVIVLGVFEDGKQITINGLSDEFRAVPITRKAIDLLSPTPLVSYDYVDHAGKQRFVIEVPKSSEEVSLGGKVYVRTGEHTTPKQTAPVKPLTEPGIEKLRKAFAEDRKACTQARAKLLDHYESVLRISRRPQAPPLPEGFEHSHRPFRRQDAHAHPLRVLRGHIRDVHVRPPVPDLPRETRNAHLTGNREG